MARYGSIAMLDAMRNKPITFVFCRSRDELGSLGHLVLCH